MEYSFPRAALIDMDGTLYDSMGNHADAWARMCAENGMPTPREEFFWHEGRTAKGTLTILFERFFGRKPTDDEVRDLYAIKTKYFRELPRVKPMPGVHRLLRSLKSMGIKRVLVTGSGQSCLISRIYEDFPDIFRPALRITSADVVKGKPDPEPYLKGMDKALVTPEESIAFENAPIGVESAAQSGAFTVGITTGPIDAGALLRSGAQVVYSSMEECADKFPKLLLEMFRK